MIQTDEMSTAIAAAAAYTQLYTHIWLSRHTVKYPGTVTVNIMLSLKMIRTTHLDCKQMWHSW